MANHCHACREVLCLKLSHGKEKLKTKEACERDIAGALVMHNKTTHLEGKTLHIDQQVYRVKVETAFLRAGVPIYKVNPKARLMEGTYISVVFDGTTRLGEAVVNLIRYVTENISQRLLRVQMIAKSMTGEEIACELIHVLSINYSVNPNSLLAAMRDRASVYNVAMRNLKIVYPTQVDVGT